MTNLIDLSPGELVPKLQQMLDDGADHFQVLGVSATADTEEIKKIFVQLARSLHPDLPAFKTPAEKAMATRVFQAATRAQMVLTDPARRAEYMHEQGISGGEDGPPAPNPDLARIHAHRARQLITRRDWVGAEESLRLANALFGEDVDDHCRVDMGWAIFNNERNLEEARAAESREIWEAVIEARGDPAAVAQAHYCMAIWCKLNGEVPLVKKHLSNCLAINARHVEAKREMRLFERRRSSSASHPRASSSSRRSATGRHDANGKTTGEHNAAPPGAAAAPGRPEAKKVPLKKKPTLLERLFGKGR
ncbi:MAG: DnaJ domain-containing protein [Myxococcales bacterium]|nr:DnaJ domain-containing protein [Myxococcales bacterium]